MDDCSFLLSTLATSILTLVIQVTNIVLTDTVTDSLVLYFFLQRIWRTCRCRLLKSSEAAVTGSLLNSRSIAQC